MKDISGSSGLTDLDDLGAYSIRVCGYITPSCPSPGVGPCGLAPLSYPIPGNSLTGFASSPTTPILRGLPLTNGDFRAHRAPMPTPYTIGPTTRPFTAPTEEPCLSYANNNQYDAFRSNCARRTRSQTVILTGNVLLRPDYHTIACSGFAASVAPASSPKAQIRSSLPPRLARLGYTIPLACLASPRPMPAPSNHRLDHSPTAAPFTLQTTAPDHDVSAAAAHLSNTLLSYSHRDWEQAQRVDSLCDATRRYIQLGCPDPPLSLFATTCPRTRGLTPQTSPTSPQKVAYSEEMMTPSCSSGSLSPWLPL